jgi:nucleotide-binding universal stress UspA family protein
VELIPFYRLYCLPRRNAGSDNGTKLAIRFGGEVTVWRAVPLVEPLTPPGAMIWDLRALDSLRETASTYLRAIAGRCARELSLYSVRLEVRIGQPASAIVDAIRDRSISLVVMATHAHAHWRRKLLGSVTDQVLRHTTVPVVLVRPQALALSADLSGSTWPISRGRRATTRL